MLFILWTLRTKAGTGESVFKVSLMASTHVHSTVALKPVDLSLAANWISLLTPTAKKQLNQNTVSVVEGKISKSVGKAKRNPCSL